MLPGSSPTTFLLMNQKHAGASWVSQGLRLWSYRLSPNIVAVRGGKLFWEMISPPPVSVIPQHIGNPFSFKESERTK